MRFLCIIKWMSYLLGSSFRVAPASILPPVFFRRLRLRGCHRLESLVPRRLLFQNRKELSYVSVAGFLVLASVAGFLVLVAEVEAWPFLNVPIPFLSQGQIRF